MKPTFLQNVSNRKGQVALFIALIFQILFLFFAMVINVGLLVHHKVNLQNSVDLAAYYGAMKQAENMNAIAHVNYQIRQSWKLLAWRYRMLGSAGEWYKHPYKKERRALNPSDPLDVVDTTDPVMNNFQEAPSFCITYIPFKPMPKGENTCRNMATESGIQLFKSTPLIAGHEAFSGVLRETSTRMREDTIERCKDFGSYNYLTLARFVVAFNIDQGDRMALIAALSKATSISSEDFYDLDGDQVRVGLEKTFQNNLTTANKASYDLKVFNSLGADGCNGLGTSDGQPAKWLTSIRIFPGFNYVDTVCPDENDQIAIKGKELNQKNLPRHMNEVAVDTQANINELAKYIGYRSNLNDNYNFSIGVEKNPWCMAYVGVSAQSSPNIPFSPFGAVKLQARAFYKPFGGRVGPWYHKVWPRGSGFSTGGNNEKVDPLLPPRIMDIGNLGSMSEDVENKKIRAANYSRFVGDQFGLKTAKMLGYWGKAIYELDPKWRSGQVVLGAGGKSDSAYEGSDAPNFNDWNHLPFDINKGSGDLLAWNSAAGAPSSMRRLELAAILPDNFDMAYYSIQPDFYHTYFKRIRDGYMAKAGTSFNKNLRPDIGYHKGFKAGNYNFDEFSVKNQYDIFNEADFDFKQVVEQSLTFTSLDWKHVLTGWIPRNSMDYSLDERRFGHCTLEHDGAKSPTSGGCAVGGSAGYSVKMVSSDYLKSQELVLGGEAGGSGPLLNPPPDDRDF